MINQFFVLGNNFRNRTSQTNINLYNMFEEEEIIHVFQ